jgi:hypothetical protein
MKTIKFRRPHFKYKDNAFSHFSYWGVNLPFKESVTEFTSPSTNSTCFHKEDQQFTGLIDRHGKEIYEGDIVKQLPGFGCEFKERTGTIEYSGASFWINLKSIAFVLDDHDCFFEVIGNIYENPELLKP